MIATIRRANLPEKQTERTFQLFDTFRRYYNEREYSVIGKNIDKVLETVEKLEAYARSVLQQTNARQDMEEMHKTLAPSMELIKKAAFTPGMIKDQSSLRQAMQQDPDLLRMVQAGANVTKKLDENSIASLEDMARKVLEGIENRKPKPRELFFGDVGYDENNPGQQFAPPDPNDPVPLPGDALAGDLAEQVLRNATLARMALKYEALGSPPWDEEKADMASELQAELFFLEAR